MTKIFAMSCNMEPVHAKKQSNVRIRRNYKRNDLAISFDKSGDVVKTFISFFSGSKQKAGSKIMWVKSELCKY